MCITGKQRYPTHFIFTQCYFLLFFTLLIFYLRIFLFYLILLNAEVPQVIKIYACGWINLTIPSEVKAKSSGSWRVKLRKCWNILRLFLSLHKMSYFAPFFPLFLTFCFAWFCYVTCSFVPFRLTISKIFLFTLRKLDLWSSVSLFCLVTLLHSFVI